MPPIVSLIKSWKYLRPAFNFLLSPFQIAKGIHR